MGGNADNSQRSSSPLKRRASDLENESVSSMKDVDMLSVHSSTSLISERKTVQLAQDSHAGSPEAIEEMPTAEIGNSDINKLPEKLSPANNSSDIPDINVQIKTITSIIEAENEKQLQEGDIVYLVSNKWLQRVKDHGAECNKLGKTSLDFEIGSIDNSDIILQVVNSVSEPNFMQLKPGLGLNEFTHFPESAWNLIVEWYGIMAGTFPITRTARNTNSQGEPNIIFEYYPLILKIHRLYVSDSPFLIPLEPSITNSKAPKMIFSRSSKWVEFLKNVKQHTGISLNQKVRVWRVPRLLSSAATVSFGKNNATPPSSRPSSPINPPPFVREPQDSWYNLLLEDSALMQLTPLAREIIDADDVSTDVKYNGSRDLSMVGLCEDQAIVLDEYIISNATWVSTYSSTSIKSSPALIRSGASLNNDNSNVRKSPARPGAMMTRGRAQKSGRTPGTVGLSNLGNTCYMNSALQCIRAVVELTKYFLGGFAMEELNRANPLGNNGEVAMAYQKLLEDIYRKDISPSYITPRHFRNTIGRYAPTFSGYGQHDSQEFLGFLLDGLQEDLSRVKKKPYIEKPDSTDEMINNPDAIRKMADEVWDITKRRDDSVIADLFTGMYKSTLVCPHCGNISITFDPFNNLTLQLPTESTWTHNVFYFPLNQRPFIMTVEIDKQGTILALKQYISTRVGVPVERLFAAEEFKCKFYKFFKDNEVASDVLHSTDHLAVYELEASPTNWPPPSRLKKKSASLYDSDIDQVPSWDDPISERILVPVIHRRPNLEPPSRYRPKDVRKKWLIDCAPHLIILTNDEARNEDSIRRKILEKVATFSTSSEFNDEGVNNITIENGEIIRENTCESEAFASCISKVSANSDEQSDISLNIDSHAASAKRPETSSAPQIQPASDSRHSKAPFQSQKHRPKWVNPSTSLKPNLQNMFQIRYCRGTRELIPTGWNTVDEDKTFPPLHTRSNQETQAFSDAAVHEDDSEERIVGSETSDDESLKFSATTRMNDESEDEDDLISTHVTQALPVRTAGSKSTGAKQFPKSRPNQQRNSNQKNRENISDNLKTDEDYSDNGPLVRLGEMLVVDWNAEIYSSIFCGDGDDDRGQSTWNTMPTHQDEALVEKQKNRLKRRKNGITLDDCLDEFAKEETLSEMDTWYCPKCREHRRASKKFDLWKTPDILIIHLKRFSSSARRRDKLDMRVDFPIEGLDLSSRVVMQNEDKEEKYDLIAVDNHWGGLGGGHYTTHAKNFYDGEWYEYNDSSVSKVKNSAEMVSSSAYLLFYRRRSDVPLGGPRLQKKIEEYDNRNSRSEDEVSEPGEDRALVGNSSLHGSSSALRGAGVVHHPQSGSESVDITVATPSLEQLPSYGSHPEIEEDSTRILGSQINGELHESIEDEGFAEGNEIPYSGFDLHSNTNNFSAGYPCGEWDFSGLDQSRVKIKSGSGSGSGSGDDISSERAQCISSPSQTSNDAFYRDIEGVSTDDDNEHFMTGTYVPAMDEGDRDATIAIQHEPHDKMSREDENFPDPQFVTDDYIVVDEDLATDIRIEDLEELKVE